MIEGYLGYFIIRPKHFGKSLMLDTISEICEGKKNKQLFKNTAIGQSPTYEWKKYAVFKFDFSKLNNESEEQFELALLNQMKENCKKYNIKHRESVGIMSLMHDMREGVANLKNGYESRAVVLIDEYQAPLNNCQNKNKIIRIMRHFFCNLKGKAMVLVTGSSRFGLADIFSPAHNLFDATLYGDLKYYYNGFKFSDNSEKKVYNPWSIIQCFSNNCIKPYWDGKCLEQYEELTLNDVESVSCAFQDPIFSACCIDLNFDTEYEHITSKSILFQTGYLTIIDYDSETHMYTLKIPNYEVKTLYLNHYKKLKEKKKKDEKLKCQAEADKKLVVPVGKKKKISKIL
ncbi:hypothetical protein HCN44_010689 [Aphidius gifuensis]|uniref:AAA-ATPase-like domain-containing protein n=1 Tax=Aphidius gifuensis TaxID=684658 RepID=A0A834XR32_APHGI|nr:hypothetical protein HCN44_010689 [Aphidius gifuensis]